MTSSEVRRPAGDRGELSERMAAAARDLQVQDDPAATYDVATALAVSNVEGCDAAGLTLVHRRREIESRGATHHGVVLADRWQQELGEGPCLDAVWESSVVHSPSVADDTRWLRWGARVIEGTGWHSILAFRLFTHQGTLGALNLYSARRDGFDDDDRADGSAIAAHVAVAVTAAQKIAHLGHALDTRTVVGQATGMVMERYGLDAAAAFGVLGRVSAADEVKLRDLALALVSTGRLHTGDPAGDRA